MDQMKTALVQVETLGERVSADQHDAVFLGEPFRRTRAFSLRVGAADGQDRAADHAERLDRRALAVGVFGIDNHVGIRMTQADQPDFQHQGRQFGIVRRCCLSEADQRKQRGRGFRAGQRGRDFLGLQFGDVLLLRCPQHAEARHAAAVRAQSALSLFQWVRAVALRHHPQRRHTGGDSRHRSFQQADEGERIRQPRPVARPLQPGRYQSGQCLVKIPHRGAIGDINLNGDDNALAEQRRARG